MRTLIKDQSVFDDLCFVQI